MSSPLKYNLINNIAAHIGAADSGKRRFLSIGSVDEFGNLSPVFKALRIGETAAGQAVTKAASAFAAAKLAFDFAAYGYAYAKCSGAIH